MDKKRPTVKTRIKQRAGGILEKNEKRDLIIEVAENLMKGREYNLPSVNEIIKASGIAKGTFYLYFKTKEEIYLAVLKKYHLLLFDKLEETTQAVDSWQNFLEAVTQTMITYAQKNPKAMYLSYIATVILENNLDEEKAFEFKIFSAERMGQLIELIATKYKLEFEETRQNLILTYNLWLSLWQYSNPPVNLEKMLKKEPLNQLVVPFSDTFQVGLEKIWGK